MNKIAALVAAVMLLGFAPPSRADITSNLIWALDFNGSTTNTGSAGGSATLTGSPSYGTGHITAQCLVLNGTSQWAEISGAAFASAQSFTVAGWIKSEDNGGEDKAPFFGAGESDDDGTLALWWFGTTSEFDASRRIGVINREATGDWNYGNSTTVPHGTWAHICVTSDGSDWALYVNGAAVTMTSTGGAANTGDSWADLTQSPIIFNIGRFPRGSTSFRLYKGSLERFRLYDRCLTSGDVAELYADTGGAANAVPIIRHYLQLMSSYRPSFPAFTAAERRQLEAVWAVALPEREPWPNRTPAQLNLLNRSAPSANPSSSYTLASTTFSKPIAITRSTGPATRSRPTSPKTPTATSTAYASRAPKSPTRSARSTSSAGYSPTSR